MKTIAVVGAGVGGLSAAARLAHQGHTVDVYEKLPKPGGRNHMLEDRGFKFDMGPSFVLMPDFFREVFDYCGEDMNAYLKLKVLDINYKIFYPRDHVLTVYRDKDKTLQEIENLEAGSSAGYERFLKKTEGFYQAVKPLLYRCFTPGMIPRPSSLKLLAALEPFTSYWDIARRYFKTEELCYAFTFEAMFMGVSPFEAPGFYSIITYADHVQKIAHPLGGMYEIPLALEKIAKKKGARFFYNSEVAAVKSAGAKVRLTVRGELKEYDKVVVNADYPYAQTDLLQRKVPDYRYSCSVLLFYLGLNKRLNVLDHHNLFFANDLRKNLDEIFKANKASEDPSFYVHVPTVTDPSLAPAGKDIAYILIPVANLKGNGVDIRASEEKLRQTVFAKINAVTGQKIEEMIEVEHKFYPEDFTKRYNIKYGSTFGLAHNLMQSAFFRPANRDAQHKNIYYVGASTQPGGGLPVVIASSRIVADMIAADADQGR